MRQRHLANRLNRLQAQVPPRARASIDWSRLTDTELERLEPIALQAKECPDVATFLATLAPADKAWLTTIAAKLDRRER